MRGEAFMTWLHILIKSVSIAFIYFLQNAKKADTHQMKMKWKSSNHNKDVCKTIAAFQMKFYDEQP